MLRTVYCICAMYVVSIGCLSDTVLSITKHIERASALIHGQSVVHFIVDPVAHGKVMDYVKIVYSQRSCYLLSDLSLLVRFNNTFIHINTCAKRFGT